jgi:hypothetical protein
MVLLRFVFRMLMQVPFGLLPMFLVPVLSRTTFRLLLLGINSGMPLSVEISFLNSALAIRTLKEQNGLSSPSICMKLICKSIPAPRPFFRGMRFVHISTIEPSVPYHEDEAIKTCNLFSPLPPNCPFSDMLAATTGPFLYLKPNVPKHVARILNQPSPSTLKKMSVALSNRNRIIRAVTDDAGGVLMTTTKTLSLFMMMSVFRIWSKIPFRTFGKPVN